MENWKVIPNMGGKYLVSDYGRVWNAYTGISNMREGSKGIIFFSICINSKSGSLPIHKIVGSLFLDKPTNFDYIKHINGNKLDNRKENLYWGKRIIIKKRISGEGNALYKHGLSKTRFYGIWNDMIMRCYNPKKKRYNCYGGRGISVCDRWKIFMNFKEDMMPLYKKGLSLERNNVNGNYEPSNCCWIPLKDQCRNKRDTVFFYLNNEKMLASDVVKKYGGNAFTMYVRKRKGWSDYECIFGKATPKIIYDGNTYTLKELTIKLGITSKAIYNRIKKGLLHRAL